MVFVTTCYYILSQVGSSYNPQVIRSSTSHTEVKSKDMFSVYVICIIVSLNYSHTYVESEIQVKCSQMIYTFFKESI